VREVDRRPGRTGALRPAVARVDADGAPFTRAAQQVTPALAILREAVAPTAGGPARRTVIRGGTWLSSTQTMRSVPGNVRSDSD